MIAKDYAVIIDECFDCKIKLELRPGIMEIEKTKITDFPFLVCPECQTELISSEFTDPIKEILSQYHIYPKQMALDEVRKMDKNNIILF